MALTLRTSIEQDFLKAELSGNYNFNEAKAVYEELMNLCKVQSKNKLFIDIRQLEGTISFFDRFNLANIFQEYINRFVKIAILIKKNPAYKEKIFETVANNRGILIKIVHSEEDALSFLEDVEIKAVNN